MFVRKIPNEELDQEDAHILHRVARRPEKLRTGEHARELRERYQDRLHRRTSMELFQLLIGEKVLSQTTLDMQRAYHRLIDSVRFEQERYLSEVRARFHRHRRFT